MSRIYHHRSHRDVRGSNMTFRDAISSIIASPYTPSGTASAFCITLVIVAWWLSVQSLDRIFHFIFAAFLELLRHRPAAVLENSWNYQLGHVLLRELSFAGGRPFRNLGICRQYVTFRPSARRLWPFQYGAPCFFSMIK